MKTTRAKTNILLHIVWTTHLRRPLLPQSHDARIQSFLQSQAAAFRSSAVAVGNTDDHIHVLMQLSPTVALSTVMQQFKGGLSRRWNELNSRPTRVEWQDGYWAESRDPRQLEVLVHYVNNQRMHHASGILNPDLEPDSSKECFMDDA